MAPETLERLGRIEDAADRGRLAFELVGLLPGRDPERIVSGVVGQAMLEGMGLGRVGRIDRDEGVGVLARSEDIIDQQRLGSLGIDAVDEGLAVAQGVRPGHTLVLGVGMRRAVEHAHPGVGGGRVERLRVAGTRVLRGFGRMAACTLTIADEVRQSGLARHPGDAKPARPRFASGRSARGRRERSRRATNGTRIDRTTGSRAGRFG